MPDQERGRELAEIARCLEVLASEVTEHRDEPATTSPAARYTILNGFAATARVAMRRGFGTSANFKLPNRLATEWGLPQVGCAVHCTCGRDDERRQWASDHDHDASCPTARPNFRHHGSGFEVRWYKYIGRDTEMSWTPNARRWADMFDECVAAVRRQGGDR